ncbi:protein HOMOLOG OF MAMMALIAN LYST-INTERACTING PROTEIN 5 isoform X2 [Magnolia sinica]|uniref:protein HOMOLOG OF MAMMALIAN LYST-INTERACTING PROTEIN 5 isoform X2 n=1 Tax=Magnolia sinica TaxID=86752 RepID=UPI00265A594A|nr:protein HOMOLOG OF MAMMALIAN LYST-INTERACTING PROTEIN 5 isoform X2 [Magnolia sinica]
MGSSADNEPAKLLLPYLQRADELQKHEHLVAYYCRLYAMERGLRIPPKERTKTTNAILVSLMNQLEKDKKSLKLGPEDNLYVEGFALNVFAKADKQDRAGRADLNTAKTFYAASIFFEILNQFGELQPDIEQKQKYAAWKAADIRKALKEGRRPEPGPPGGEKDLSIPSTNTSSTTYDLGPTESYPANQPGVDTSSQFVDPANQPRVDTSSRFVENVNQQPSTNSHTSPSSYSSADFPSNDFKQTPPPPPPPTGRSEDSYPQPYHHPSYSHEQPFPQTYPSHESSDPSHSYANYQSYPSFNESNLPLAPDHYPSYYQGSDAAYSHQPGPPASNFPPTVQSHQLGSAPSNYPSAVPSHQSGSAPSNYLSTVQPHQSSSLPSNYTSALQYDSSSRNGSQPEPAPPSTNSFVYDSNYLPPPDKIAEAHKAARFAVGALAFDDVPVAVDFLRRSLELLTNPSANPSASQ